MYSLPDVAVIKWKDRTEQKGSVSEAQVCDGGSGGDRGTYRKGDRIQAPMQPAINHL